MANIENLRSELTGDPLTRGYAGMSDADVAASLNVVDRPAPVPAKDVAKYLQLVGKWAAIALAAQTTLAPRALVDALATFGDFDLSDAQVAAVVGARLDDLIGGEFITTDDKAAILALGNNRRSRAQEIALGIVNLGDVMAARRVE